MICKPMTSVIHDLRSNDKCPHAYGEGISLAHMRGSWIESEPVAQGAYMAGRAGRTLYTRSI